MNPREMLSRCTAGAVGYEPRGSRVYGGLSPSDMASAVGRIKGQTGQLLVLYLWADHCHSEGLLLNLLLEPVSKLCVDKGWKVRRPGLLSGILTTILHELKSPRVCRLCNGLGIRAGVACEPCSGIGRRPMAGQTRAEVAGIPYDTWRHWERRYADIMAIVEDCERDAVRQMAYALRA